MSSPLSSRPSSSKISVYYDPSSFSPSSSSSSSATLFNHHTLLDELHRNPNKNYWRRQMSRFLRHYNIERELWDAKPEFGDMTTPYDEVMCAFLNTPISTTDEKGRVFENCLKRREYFATRLVENCTLKVNSYGKIVRPDAFKVTEGEGFIYFKPKGWIAPLAVFCPMERKKDTAEMLFECIQNLVLDVNGEQNDSRARFAFAFDGEHCIFIELSKADEKNGGTRTIKTSSMKTNIDDPKDHPKVLALFKVLSMKMSYRVPRSGPPVTFRDIFGEWLYKQATSKYVTWKGKEPICGRASVDTSLPRGAGVPPCLCHGVKCA